ncbi:MAG: sulfide/dihydroorotate dehydrogenase-like FAD/NAD-binding protein [Elusimicrobiota bacterium]|jgi:ferredoxin--NADP+ reductase|nr:sulfide/dihydroorotate dehydrogenase-like FAD/NAD-binding protein [Elusimicrobiota bacterium]
MYKIISKQKLASNITSFWLEAPDIAKNAKAGQFIIFRIDDKGERVPLTIAGVDSKKGLVRIIFQHAGKSTTALSTLEEGDSVRDFLGPLGQPTEIEKYGTVCIVSGGVGTAEILPVIDALKSAGNKVISIVGARTKELLLLEDEIRKASTELLVATDDGSYGVKGFVTDILKDVISKEKVDIIYAIGPVPMMKAVANLTREKGLKTLASLNPIMVDGTGMCGACRVTVDGKTKFACVDGPEFDAHKVNWDELISRLGTFKDLEKISLDEFINGGCKCHRG